MEERAQEQEVQGGAVGEEDEDEEQERVDLEQEASGVGWSWLLPERHFLGRAYSWVMRSLSPLRVRGLVLGLQGCGKSLLLERMQTGMAPSPGSVVEPRLSPVWHDVCYKHIIFQLLDTSGFLDTRPLWAQHLANSCSAQEERTHGQLKALVFVVDCTHRELLESRHQCFRAPLLSALRQAPHLSALLVLLHDPHHHQDAKAKAEPPSLDAEAVSELLGLTGRSQGGDEAGGAVEGSIPLEDQQGLLDEGAAATGGHHHQEHKGHLPPPSPPRQPLPWRVQPCSAWSGRGLSHALHWLAHHTTNQQQPPLHHH